MTNHTEALEAAILAAGFDPRNELVRKSSQALVEKYIEEATPTEAFRKTAEAGWNACRRQVYLLSEDYIEKTHALKETVDSDVERNFYRGQYDVAKSFAKAFSAFEAADCDYFRQIVFRAPSAGGEKVKAHADDLAVDQFATAMKSKLAAKREQGYGGWDDPEDCSIAWLSDRLRWHVFKGDPVDVANFAMMVHQRGGWIE